MCNDFSTEFLISYENEMKEIKKNINAQNLRKVLTVNSHSNPI